MAMLMTLLFSFLVQNTRVEKRMESARIAILERQNLQTRLQDLLTSLSRATLLPPLYTQTFPKEEKESLVVLFDNGIDPDPAFSGTLTGRLYLDEKRNLCLVSWPLAPDKNRPWRKEVLLSKVSDFSLQFLGEKKEAEPLLKPITPSAGWHARWSKERIDLPSLIRLYVRQGETPLQFAFRLPTADPIATYREKGAQ